MLGKKFRFSLQKVLELRRHETKRAQQELADAKRELELKKTQLKQARQYLAKCQRTESDAEDLRPAELRKAEVYRKEARRAVEDAREALDTCRDRVEQAREAYHERRQAEEALEKLREEKKGEFDDERQRAETEFFDEQAVMRHHRTDGISLL